MYNYNIFVNVVVAMGFARILGGAMKKKKIYISIILICITVYVVWRIADRRYPTIKLEEEPKGIYTYSYDERLTVLYDDSIVIYDEYGKSTEYIVDSDVVIADMYPVGDFAWVIDESKNLYKMSYLAEGKVQFSDIILVDIVDLAAEDDSFCAVTSDGELYVWGNNEYSSLGLKDIEYVDEPTKIDYISMVSQVVFVNSGTYVLKHNGTVFYSGWACGYNQNGEAYETNIEEYTLIEELHGIKEIYGGYMFYAIDSDGNITCSSGYTYDDKNEKYNVEFAEEISHECQSKNICKFSGGVKYSIGLSEEGFIYLWGVNYAKAPVDKSGHEYLYAPEKIPRIGKVDNAYGALSTIYAKKGLTIYIIGGK